ncbi:hypothetical protein O2W15_08380 [Modestobacter sp. VKM Ac-2979]|uniref:hypothetical protein n=1 Tax=unclassified Modestobacter TaxID=2643866 RepID=UPI0022ABBB4F|nr:MULTISPECIES: hypothetical protein [unclassified Modestobacter]MCZ2811451.1 hypothetical protein [Modestobacter sp. VKM Ac-2979]MCZ2840965.1 hypothetical protein [Modestobacter sp. VKM Ac-2980]
MNPAESLQLGALYDALRTPAPMPADPTQLTSWMARVEADAALTGLISRVLNSGSATEAEVTDAQALFEKSGTAADPARVARAYDVLHRNAD